jgi:outer membrane lipoprotein carrier protein
MVRVIIVCMSVLVIGAWSLFAQQNVVGNVQRTYRDIDNAVIEYEQRVEFPVTRNEQVFTGIVYMQKPNLYRIESEQQTVVTDGNDIWSYNPFTEQVIIDSYREEEEMFTPDRFLLNIPDDFYVTVGERETVGERSLITLRLIPKDEHQYVRSMRMWVDESGWLVRKAEVIDLNDTKTTYVVRTIEINRGIDASLFTYDPPPDAEIIDLR